MGSGRLQARQGGEVVAGRGNARLQQIAAVAPKAVPRLFVVSAVLLAAEAERAAGGAPAAGWCEVEAQVEVGGVVGCGVGVGCVLRRRH